MCVLSELQFALHSENRVKPTLILGVEMNEITLTLRKIKKNKLNYLAWKSAHIFMVVFIHLC